MSQDLTETASLLSDPGRTSIVMALLGNIALPAGQLAIIANVAPQTASSHLAKLVSGQILAVEQQGRHRYYRLANHRDPEQWFRTGAQDARQKSADRDIGVCPHLLFAPGGEARGRDRGGSRTA